MGLFDFVSDVVSASVKVVLTPVAVVKDAASVVVGLEPDATKELLKSAGEDLSDAADEIMP
jgi:hypothetical protein